MDWSAKKVVVLGAARQGTALARYLALHGARVVLSDQRSAAQLQFVQNSLVEATRQAPGSIEFVFGGHPLELLDGADLLCLSGGVPLTLPLVDEAQRRGIPLSNDSQIFLDAAPCRVTGITGAAGKTTTTTLVGRMAAAAVTGGQRAYVGGNIGSPLISEVDAMAPGDIAVMELSSFQLEIMTRSPQVAAVLNITPNHLDRHVSMEEYTAAKARIVDFQSQADVAVLGRDDPGSWALADRLHGRLLSFGLSALARGQDGTYVHEGEVILREGSSETRLLPVSLVKLRGEHNLFNVLAACAIAAAAGFSPEAMQAGVEGFQGVPHRLEFVRTWQGVAWYNDSIATAPERAIAAIHSFDEPLVLLAGGRDKNLPWQEFAALVQQRVDHLILFGEAAQKIARAMETYGSAGTGRLQTVTLCEKLSEAVQAAANLAEPGAVVLLTPGGTSFDAFRDFEERGEAFRKWVMELP